jgi:hypothetical protein
MIDLQYYPSKINFNHQLITNRLVKEMFWSELLNPVYDTQKNEWRRVTFFMDREKARPGSFPPGLIVILNVQQPTALRPRKSASTC